CAINLDAYGIRSGTGKWRETFGACDRDAFDQRIAARNTNASIEARDGSPTHHCDVGESGSNIDADWAGPEYLTTREKPGTDAGDDLIVQEQRYPTCSDGDARGKGRGDRPGDLVGAWRCDRTTA